MHNFNYMSKREITEQETIIVSHPTCINEKVKGQRERI